MRTKMLTIALSLLVAGGAALAQQPGRRATMNWSRHPMLFAQLKLTDQQKSEAKKVWFDLAQKQIDARAKLQHARLDYHELASAQKPDQKALNSKIQEMADLRAQLAQNKLDAWFSVNKLLTPEQQKVWQKVLEHPMMFQHSGRMNGRGHFNGMMMRRGGMMNGPSMMQRSGSWRGGMGPMMRQNPSWPDTSK